MVDEALDVPPYRQVFEQIRAAIERGELQPETLLPPVRQLAGDLGVAPNTVARAYGELQSEGWLRSDGRRGTRVASDVPVPNARERAHALRDAVAKFAETLLHRGFTRREIAEALHRRASAET
ncbi:MAG: GntR family transcriptional regulator [Candidatus Eremiobacteraeota bacterium]|nr:GntR family transcriptional regulator [Candidatus Eremiobacteraeota bacterium]